MGLGLQLLVMTGPEVLGVSEFSSYDLLQLYDDYRIYGQLRDMTKDDRGIDALPHIVPQILPPQLEIGIWEDEGYRLTRFDADGEELTFVYARQLKELKLQPDTHWRNKAIKAYVDALPDEVPIVLFWR